MENLSNGQHRGPVPSDVIFKPEALARERREAKEKKGGKKADSEDRRSTWGRSRAPKGDAATELKRAKARAYYHANKERFAKQKRDQYAKSKAVRVVPESDEPPTVPKRPGKVDALICINRSLLFLERGDTDGAELWSRFAARIIEGKE